MNRLLLLAVCLSALLLPACGGGSGGAEEAPPTPPGVLRAVAIQGQGALGSAGLYAAFPPFPLMDAHASGWVAFVAPTSDGVKTSVLNAMAPDGTLIHVFAVGDAAPGLPDGTITGFGGVWVGNGFVFAQVTIAGNAMLRTSGIVSATLSAGSGASARTGVLWHKTGIPGTADTIGAFDVVKPAVESDGTIWLLVDGETAGDPYLVSIERTGSGLTTRAQVNGTLTSGVTVVSIDAFAVDVTGVVFALVASTNQGDRRLYVHLVASGPFVEVMKDGDAIPGSANAVADIHSAGTLSVYPTGRVVWMAESNSAIPDEVFLTGDGAGAAGVILLAQSGDTAPLSGNGMFTALFGLNLRSAVTIPQFGAAVNASGNGVTFGTYGMVGSTPPVTVLATDNISPSTAGLLGATYVGLAPANAYREVSQNGSFLFANILQTGLSAVLWLIPGDRIYGLAVQGGATPQGDSFGSFAAISAHTVANGVALFRVPLNAAGSGIFRQGP